MPSLERTSGEAGFLKLSRPLAPPARGQLLIEGLQLRAAEARTRTGLLRAAAARLAGARDLSARLTRTVAAADRVTRCGCRSEQAPDCSPVLASATRGALRT